MGALISVYFEKKLKVNSETRFFSIVFITIFISLLLQHSTALQFWNHGRKANKAHARKISQEDTHLRDRLVRQRRKLECCNLCKALHGSKHSSISHSRSHFFAGSGHHKCHIFLHNNIYRHMETLNRFDSNSTIDHHQLLFQDCLPNACFNHEHSALFCSSMQDAYETYCGERGVHLSGGQKSIALARAILKNPSILLLDEETSALESLSKSLVQEALDKMMVAHRLSTKQKADCITVIKNGKIVEEGSHSELLALGDDGAYHSLVRLQHILHRSYLQYTDVIV